MADFQSSDRSTLIDLQIKTLTQEKEILQLKDRISELEDRASTPRNEPSYVVTNVAPDGRIQLNVCDTAHASATPAVGVHQRSTSDPLTVITKRKREKKVVNIETRKHADTFNFKQKDEWMDNHQGEVVDLPDELRRRNCLVKAVKQNCGDITQDVTMQGGMFLDQLYSVRCLDDEERKLIAETRAQEANQMRAVIVVIVKKDFKTILSFVACIREDNKDLAEKIVHSYTNLASSGYGQEDQCWWCLLKSRVKFAVFVDNMYSNGLIEDQLYLEASREDMSPAERQKIWNDLATQLTPRDNIRGTMEHLRDAIVDSGVHSDIVSSISLAIDRQSFVLRCTCGPQMEELKPIAFEKDMNGDSGNNTFAHSAREIREDARSALEIRGEAQEADGGELSSGFGAD